MRGALVLGLVGAAVQSHRDARALELRCGRQLLLCGGGGGRSCPPPGCQLSIFWQVLSHWLCCGLEPWFGAPVQEGWAACDMHSLSKAS